MGGLGFGQGFFGQYTLQGVLAAIVRFRSVRRTSVGDIVSVRSMGEIGS